MGLSEGYNRVTAAKGAVLNNDGLTRPQRFALEAIADGAEHECWKRSTDAPGTGHGRVNNTAAHALARRKLARIIYPPSDWPSSRYVAGNVQITDAGRAVLDA